MRYAGPLAGRHDSSRVRAYAVPGKLVLKLAAGEVPGHVPWSTGMCRAGRAMAEAIDGGPIDRILRRLGGGFRASHLHCPARAVSSSVRGRLPFDDVEQISGVARTLVVQLQEPHDVTDVVRALSGVAVVEEAVPYFLCQVPMRHEPTTLPFSDSHAAWSRAQVRANEALGYEPGDGAVIVAVIDTGVAQSHPELPMLRAGFDTVQLGPRELPAGAHIVGDSLGPDSDPVDEVGHGTGCAGIVGAAGLEIPPGLAGACSVLPVRVLGAASVPGKEGRVGIGALPDIDAGIKMAVDLGARILSLSLGTQASAIGPEQRPPHADSIAYAQMRGCIVVAASGNSGVEERYYPAALDDVIAVGAVDDADRLADFSTRGEHVALSAPGVKIASAGLRGYQLLTGTSFAAPFVAATAALMVSRALRRAFPLDCRTARNILTASARSWPGAHERGGGAGILDALGALQQLDAVIDRRADVEGFGADFALEGLL